MVFLPRGMWVHGRVNVYIGAVLQLDGSSSNWTVLMCNQMVRISITVAPLIAAPPPVNKVIFNSLKIMSCWQIYSMVSHLVHITSDRKVCALESGAALVCSVGSQHESEEIVHFQESTILHTIYGQ